MALALAPPSSPRSAAAQSRAYRTDRQAAHAPFLSAIIVNYRQWLGTADLTRRLLTSPAGREGRLEVMVVDNHSPAHRVAARLRRWSGVSFRRWADNRGFARAVNEGSRLSRGRWLLLLNPDVTIAEGFVEGVVRLASRLEAEEPRAGIVGFQLRNSDGSHQPSTGMFPTLMGTLGGLLLPRARRKYRTPRSQERSRVPWVTGCCLLVRRDCVEDLGGLDNDFFLYYEDVDLCRRAWQNGWQVWYEPALSATHHSPLHSRPVPPHLRVVTRHSLLTYAGKHWSGWKAHLLARIVWLESRARALWARRQGDSDAAGAFRALGELARAMARGRKQQACRLLGRVVRRQERHLAS